MKEDALGALVIVGIFAVLGVLVISLAVERRSHREWFVECAKHRPITECEQGLDVLRGK